MASAIAAISAIVAVHLTVSIEAHHIIESVCPCSSRIRTIRIPQPYQPGKIIRYRAVGSRETGAGISHAL